MKEFHHVIQNKMGLHIRPASNLAALVRQYHSVIYIIYRKQMVRANRIVETMNLNIPYGEDILIQIEGIDENQALQELKSFCQREL